MTALLLWKERTDVWLKTAEKSVMLKRKYITVVNGIGGGAELLAIGLLSILFLANR